MKMTQYTNQTPKNLIKNNFTPCIGVLCSPLAEKCCEKNNLNFIELLQPFCQLNTDLNFRDYNGSIVTVMNLQLTFQDINSKPPQTSLARRYLNASVCELNNNNKNSNKNDNIDDQRPINVANNSSLNNIKCHNNSVKKGQHSTEQLPFYTPWFERWTETFFQIQYPSDHEFIKHFLACLIIISSDEADAMSEIEKFTQTLQQHQISGQGKLPKFFNTHILKYYVIVHDNTDGDTEKAKELYHHMKQTYDESSCFLLAINSRSSLSNNNNTNSNNNNHNNKKNNSSSSSNGTAYNTDPWSQFIGNKLEVKYSRQQLTDINPSGGIGLVHSNSIENNLPYYNCDDSDLVKNHIGTDLHPLSPQIEQINILSYETGGGLVVNSASSALQTNSNNDPINVQQLKIKHHHGSCLTSDDIEQIKLLILEFTKDCLLPYVERQIQQLSDSISNKKGVSRSLFSATKRWFNPNKPGSITLPTTTTTTVTTLNSHNNLIYTSDAAELQVRKLGDLYFLFGQYNAAFQAYHLAKRDYSTDQAWLYYAGALEMAALSAFMANETNRRTYEYIEESITTYLNTCKLPQFATRATLLSTMCMKSQGMFGEAARQLIRMTSEDSDLRSALFLEQAAYCFLHSSMLRKYAFHMVLAGHRYLKAAQRRHSLRTYKQAYQIYSHSGWILAEDHIHYTIGRLAHILHHFNQALCSFTNLLNGQSNQQSANQQFIYFTEYLTILKNKQRSENNPDDTKQFLILPEINYPELKFVLGPTQPITIPGKCISTGIALSYTMPIDTNWLKLEECLYNHVNHPNRKANGGGGNGVFKPIITLCLINEFIKKCEESTTNPNVCAVIGEPIQLVISMRNPLKVPLYLNDCYLLWHFIDDANAMYTNTSNWNDNEKCVQTHRLETIIISGAAIQQIVLAVTPLITGFIHITGFCYGLSNTDGSLNDDHIVIKGRQQFTFDLNGRKFDRIRLQTVPTAPCLEVSMPDLDQKLLSNELRKISVDFRNIGTIPICNIYVTTSHPHLIHHTDQILYDSIIIIPVPIKLNHLDPNEIATIDLWLKAPQESGEHVIAFLIYYESNQKNCTPKYRLVRHIFNVNVLESLNVELTSQPSFKNNPYQFIKENNDDVSIIEQEIDIVLKMMNLNSIQYSTTLIEISIINVGLLSTDWYLTTDIITPKHITLYSEQSVYILLKAKRRTNPELLHSSYTTILLNTERPFRQNLNTIYTAFGDKYKNEFLSQQPDGIVLLQWQAVINENGIKRLVNGQCETILNVQYRIDDNDDNEKLKNDFPEEKFTSSTDDIIIKQQNDDTTKILYNIVHPAVIEHNFEEHKLCLIPVTLLLHSIVRNTCLMVIINTLGPTISSPCSNSTQMNVYYPSSCKNFVWLGCGNTRTILKPLTSESINLAIAVTRPGTFNLGAYLQILCNAIDQEEIDREQQQFPSIDNFTLQFNRIQSTLIVNDSSKQ